MDPYGDTALHACNWCRLVLTLSSVLLCDTLIRSSILLLIFVHQAHPPNFLR
jgi:hypothetical protein